jgi:hypothetical protein
MLEDMKMRNLSSHTQTAYVRAVAQFAEHFGRSPDQLDREHVRQYLLGLIERGVAWSSYNQARCALHFFYRVTLGEDWPRRRVRLVASHATAKAKPAVLVLRLAGHGVEGRVRVVVEGAAPVRFASAATRLGRRSQEPFTAEFKEGHRSLRSWLGNSLEAWLFRGPLGR